MLKAKEKSELIILHHKNHHTAGQTERFNELLSKSYTNDRPYKIPAQIRPKRIIPTKAETMAKISEKFGA